MVEFIEMVVGAAFAWVQRGAIGRLIANARQRMQGTALVNFVEEMELRLSEGQPVIVKNCLVLLALYVVVLAMVSAGSSTPFLGPLNLKGSTGVVLISLGVMSSVIYLNGVDLTKGFNQTGDV